jgi:hypothetical protein
LDSPINKHDDLGAFGLKRKDSAKAYRQKSDLSFKILMFFGILLLIISVILWALSMYSTGTNPDYASISNSVFSLSLIFIAFAVIFYFFKKQFSKLAEIAEEIENCTDFSDEEVE